MSSENNVKAARVVFGAAGTSTSLTAPTTDTSNPYPLPRNDFTLGLTVNGSLVTTTASTTASSTAAATVVLQVSNDNIGWFGISSASATGTVMSTNTGTALDLTSTAAVGIEITGKRYAYGRTVVAVTGTGNASVSMGS